VLVDEALLEHMAGFRAHHGLLRRLAGDCARMEASRSANRCSESSFRKQKHAKSRTGTMHCSALRANALLRAYAPGDARFCLCIQFVHLHSLDAHQACGRRS
jgi:hypothetical protein